MSDSCRLCLAANNEDDCLIYRDELVFISMNIEPLKTSHVMVMPVRHARQLSDLTAVEAEAFLKAIDRCMETAPKVSPEPSICLINGWTHRTQDHLHAHVLSSKVSLRDFLVLSEGAEYRKRASEEDLRALATRFKEVFEAGR